LFSGIKGAVGDILLWGDDGLLLWWIKRVALVWFSRFGDLSKVKWCEPNGEKVNLCLS